MNRPASLEHFNNKTSQAISLISVPELKLKMQQQASVFEEKKQQQKTNKQKKHISATAVSNGYIQVG